MLIALVMFVPLIVGLSYAFRDIQILNPFATGWVGLAHFETLLGDRIFYRALGNTLWWTGGSVVAPVRPRPRPRACCSTARSAAAGWSRRVVFLPWAVPTFLSGLTWAWLFNPVIGPLPHWLAALGILAEPYNILGDPAHRHVGADRRQCLVRRAVLRDHAARRPAGDPALALRGRGDRRRLAPGRRFTKVTLPFLAPIIAITVLLRTIWISNFADLIVVMTNGGPANATQILPSYIFTTAYKKLDFGYASAIATALLALLLLYAADPDPHAPRPAGHNDERAPPRSIALKSLGRSAALTVGHRAAIACYMLFALFPLFWLIKIAVTPDRLLYSEGIRLWPSSTTLRQFPFRPAAERLPDLLRQLGDGLARHRARRHARRERLPATPSRASASPASTRWCSSCC